MFLFHAVLTDYSVGSISAALSFLVCVSPREELRGRNADSFPEQRLVIEPNYSASLILKYVLSTEAQYISHVLSLSI